MKEIKLKFIAIICIFLILGMPVYTARVFAQDDEQETTEDKGIIVDNTPPSITIEELPEKVTEPFLDIKGTTSEFIVIEVTLNSDCYDTINSNEDNTFSIGITLTEGENKITINSTDVGGNSVIKEFDVFCDSEQPQILYNNIYELSPAYTAKQTVKGQVNKPNINIDVFVNEKEKYSGKSDSDGNFEIDIKLEKSIKIGVTDKSITVGTQEENAWENKIKIVATDDYGRETTVEETILYTLCGYGSDWDVKTDKITPEVIIPEHLIQGIAQFSFPINLTYRGRGDPSEVSLTSEPQLTSYELSMSSQEKFQDELFPGSAMGYWDDDYTHGYFIVNLNAWPYSKDELNNLSFIKIPLRLDIYYEYEDINGDIVENTQRNCWTISIMVDKEVPLDKIPKKLLNTTINLLNSTINLIDAIKKPIDTIKTYTFIGCAGSWIVYLGQSIASEFSCVGVKKEAVQALINDKDTCVSIQEVGDCDACLQSLKSLRETEKVRNWLCDRIFCPAVPSLNYHTETYKDSITNQEKNLCKKRGKDSKQCEEEYKRAWDSAFVMIDEWEKANAKEGEIEESFFDKISEGLAFCEKAKDQEITVVTVDSGNKQKTYLIDNEGNVWEAEERVEIKVGDKEPEGVWVGKENEDMVFYGYGNKIEADEQGYLIFEENGIIYYIDKEGKTSEYNEDVKESDIDKLPSIVQSKRGIEGKDNYILDPTSDIIRSVQAVCLPAVSGYLNLWKQILEAVKQCFETIMITGEGSAGVCKAVLTTYVCDMIYDVIRCTGESFSFGAGEEISGGITGVMQKISTAGKNVADSVSSRYGQTGMYKTMFVDRKLIHSMCLFAFTGDWGEFDLDTMLSAEVGMPTLGSQGLLYPTTRRFIGSNPLEYGRTTYIYHIGTGIIAGADLNYIVYLKCSNDNSCTDGRCDCFYKGKEEVYNIASGSLSAGDMFSGEFFEKIIDSPVRYDKAVIEWDWTDNKGEMQTTTKVQNIEEAGEKTPDDCKLDSKSGEFRCKYIIGQYGDARFIDIYPSDNRNLKKVPYSIGETINFDVEIEIIPPGSGDKIPKYLVWKVTDHKNKEIERDTIKIPKTDGRWEDKLPGYTIGDVFGSETGDKIKGIDSLKGYKNQLDVNLDLIQYSTTDTRFAVIFTAEDYYEVCYDLSKDTGGWYIKNDDDCKGRTYNKDNKIIKIEYGEGKGVEFNLNSNPDFSKDGNWGAVIEVEKGQKIEGCVDGEAKWKVKFELLHSKENKEGRYECCGRSIDSEEFEITIDCGREAHDEEQPCETNELINEKCKCGEDYCGDIVEGWNICCEKGDELKCIGSDKIDEEKKIGGEYAISGSSISQDYLNELCGLS